MLQYIAIGGGLAFAAAMQPGPFQAYLLSRVAAIGWRRTLPAACAPLLSDGPIALVALVILGQLSPILQALLRGGGGVLLCVFAWRTYQQWRQDTHRTRSEPGRVPRTILEAALVNLLNPNPYLGWTLVLGPAVVSAWREEPAAGVAVVVSFYVVMIASTAALIVAFDGARWFGPKLQRALLGASALVLAGLGVYQFLAVLVALGAL